MRSLFVLGIACLGPISAQVVVDVPLGAPLPGLSGPVFAGPTSVSVAGTASGGSIRTWTGLPGAPVASVLAFSGPLAMAGPWTRLDDRTAAYDAAGGMVALVHGLPDAPQPIATAFAGPSAELRGVNATTAVRVSAAGFHVLRHDATSSSQSFVPAPEILVLGGNTGVGAAGADTFLAPGAGPDGVPHTADDRLVRLDGLAGPGPFTATSLPLSLTFAPEGFLVAPSGAAVAWTRSGLGAFDLVVIQVSGPSVIQIPLAITTPAPFGFWVAGSWNYSVGAVAPDGVLFTHDDDVGFGRVLIGNLRGTPGIVQSWFDDPFNAYVSSTVLNDRDIAFLDFVNLTGFGYVRWTDGVAESWSASEPYNFAGMSFVVPDHRVIAAFSQVWSGTIIGQQDAVITIERQLPGGHSTVSFDAPDAAWIGTAPFALGPGRVAGFLRRDVSGPAPSDHLRICSFGVASAHEASGARFAPAIPALHFQPPVPSLAVPLTIQITLYGPAPTAAFLGVALERAEPVHLAPFDAVLHLDPARLFALLPVGFTGGAASVSISGGLPPALDGIPFHLQLAAASGGQVRLSDLAVLVYGP